MRARMKAMGLIVMGLLMMSAGTLGAQAPAPAGQTASQFYVAYRAAFDKATKVDELLPYMSAAQKKQIEATPAAERPKMFEFLKMVATLTDVKVTKEEKAGTGATLTATGVDSDKKKQTGTIKIVREGGAWKLGEESWK
ncbi:MAG: hypothetical protein ABI634_17150 [Acidobacteriota bacterium]